MEYEKIFQPMEQAKPDKGLGLRAYQTEKQEFLASFKAEESEWSGVRNQVFELRKRELQEKLAEATDPAEIYKLRKTINLAKAYAGNKVFYWQREIKLGVNAEVFGDSEFVVNSQNLKSLQNLQEIAIQDQAKALEAAMNTNKRLPERQEVVELGKRSIEFGQKVNKTEKAKETDNGLLFKEEIEWVEGKWNKVKAQAMLGLERVKQTWKENKNQAIGTGLALIGLGALYLTLNFSEKPQSDRANKTLNTSLPTITETSFAVSTITPLASPTEIRPTVTPEPTRMPFTVETENNQILNISQSFSLEWSNHLIKSVGDKGLYISGQTDPVLINSVMDNSNVGNLFGGRDNILNVPAYKRRPDLAGVIRTMSNNRTVIEIHSGKLLYTAPSEYEENWLSRWQEANPEKDINSKQEINLTGQIFVDLEQTLQSSEENLIFPDGNGNNINYPIRVYKINGNYLIKTVQNGQEITWNIVDMRKVPVELISKTMGTIENGGFVSDLEALGIRQWNSPGFTLVMCDGFNSKTHEYDSRLLVTLVPETDPIQLGGFANRVNNDPNIMDAVTLADTTNSYQFTDQRTGMGDYLMKSEWYLNRSEEDRNSLKPILSSLVNSGTNLFSDPYLSGIQCIGLSGIMAGNIYNPVFIGGDKVVGPAGVVPQEVKTASLRNRFYSIESGRREWWTGDVQLSSLNRGDQILSWGTGARTAQGVDIGHVREIVSTYFDGNGKIHLLISEANSAQFPGMVSLYEVVEDGVNDTLEEVMGPNLAVLVKNENESANR